MNEIVSLCVGSKNRVKIEAVRETAAAYDFLRSARVEAMEVPTDVADQPVGWDAVVSGATNRARKARELSGADLGIGIEDGLVPVPGTRSGYMNFWICAVDDGRTVFLGATPGCEFPPDAVRLALESHLNMSDACRKLGYTDHEYVGYANGMIGLLTFDRITRKDATKQAVITALAHMEYSRRVRPI